MSEEFEKWWKEYAQQPYSYNDAKAAWNAAIESTKSEKNQFACHYCMDLNNGQPWPHCTLERRINQEACSLEYTVKKKEDCEYWKEVK